MVFNLYTFNFIFNYFWLVEGSIFLILIALIIYLIRKNTEIVQHYKNSHLEQQQFIKQERQRISGEIHDDIGSGLFSIQLFVDIASKKRSDTEEIQQISDMINEMSEKINEIIWSTNTESDNLENLLYYIEHQTIKLFEYTDIDFDPKFPFEVPDLVINSQSRRNIYLLIKEIVNNAVKHSKATNVFLNADICNGILIFEIKDNGIGFSFEDVRHDARGLKNIKIRVEDLKGELSVEYDRGTTVVVKIPLEKVLAYTI